MSFHVVFLFAPSDNIISLIFYNRGRYQGVWDKDDRASSDTDDPRHRGWEQANGGGHRGERFRWRPRVGAWLSLSSRTL